MDTLLGENGCPWDLEQTHESIKVNLIEECYEVIDAINLTDMDSLCEELGDVLLQVIFHSKLAEKEEAFTLDQVIDGISKKMVLRHPHIFGHVQADTSDQVLRNWDAIKMEEKGFESNTQALRSVPKVLPALLRAYKVQKKAVKTELIEWSAEDSIQGAIDGLNALKEQISEKSTFTNRIFEDILFFLVNIAGFFELNPEFALTNATEQFINRFENIENTFVSEGIAKKSCHTLKSTKNN